MVEVSITPLVEAIYGQLFARISIRQGGTRNLNINEHNVFAKPLSQRILL